MVKFFVSAASDKDQAESVYASVVRSVQEQAGPVTSDRWYSLSYTHNGRRMVATAGEAEGLTGEVVVAILRSRSESGPFYICTPNRGVLRGEPILASGSWDSVATPFSDGAA